MFFESFADDFEGATIAKHRSRKVELNFYLERTIIALVAYMD